MSRNHINFVVKTGFVLCEVGTEFCTEFKRISHFNGHVVATSLSPQTPRFDTRPFQLGFVVPEVALGASVFPCQYHSTITPCKSLSICYSYLKDTDQICEPSKSNALSDIKQH